MENKIIPYGKQQISEEDIQAVVEALKGDFLTQGPKVKEFEEKFAKYVDVKYAVAVSNGTAALHLSALALNVQKGQKIITTPITFSATANCIEYCGGQVVFADIDSETYLLDVNAVKKLLGASPKGTYVGIIPVDFGGKAVNLEEFRKIAEEYNLWILADACHAPGGYFTDSKGVQQKCGNGVYADLSIFSFHPVKHITSGEGGMITTNNQELYNKLLELRTHGITRETSKFANSVELAGGENGKYPAWYMEMQNLGYNYRLTDIQSALGISQLARAEEGIKRRKEISEVYNKAFQHEDFILRKPVIEDEHAFHLYVLEVKDRLGLYNYLKENNILTQIHYFPTYLMPYYQEKGWREGDFPQSESYYKNCISLPMYPSLTQEEQEYVIERVKSFYK